MSPSLCSLSGSQSFAADLALITNTEGHLYNLGLQKSCHNGKFGWHHLVWSPRKIWPPVLPSHHLFSWWFKKAPSLARVIFKCCEVRGGGYRGQLVQKGSSHLFIFVSSEVIYISERVWRRPSSPSSLPGAVQIHITWSPQMRLRCFSSWLA